MSAGVTIWRLPELPRRIFFPEPLLYARAVTATSSRPTAFHDAVVEEISVIRHMIGQEKLAAAPHRERAHAGRPAHDGGPAR